MRWWPLKPETISSYVGDFSFAGIILISSVIIKFNSKPFRKAKLEAKKVREEREEQCRQQEDIEEAIYKAAERKRSIKHAKTLTFAQTDRVKGFHGALILTEVLKEREAQLELKKERLQARVSARI